MEVFNLSGISKAAKVPLRVIKSRGLQKVWGTSAEMCLVPFFRVGAQTLPHLLPSK